MNAFVRSFAFTLAFTAMLVRALLPAGWMPAADGGTFVICTADGGIHVPAPGRQHTLPDHSPQVCPFAAAAHLASPQPAAILGHTSALVHDAPRANATSVLARAAPYRAQAPRAPPSLV